MKESKKIINSSIARRQFLKNSAFLGGSALLMSQINSVFKFIPDTYGFNYNSDAKLHGNSDLSSAENVINTVCLNCNTQCTIKVRNLDGITVKIDGNPYSPQNLSPQIDYDTDPYQGAKFDGKLCPKGQAGVQIQYDPYRIRKVLKRAGKRGENKWAAISFEQAIKEIVDGGLLFKNVQGEETRHVKGLKDVFMLRDPAVAKAMADDVTKIRKKEMSAADFKTKYREHLEMLINPDHPDLGPKNNEFVFMAGRIEPGRSDFTKRFVNGGFGSINWYEHTTICEQSHHVAFKLMTAQYENGKWNPGPAHMKPNYSESEFVIFWGTGAFEANFGPPPISEQITASLVERNFKIAVIDPRFSKTAAKAWKWIPVKPGDGDSALAMGMIRWIIENERYDRKFLANANKSAAKASGELSWTNASWLVKVEHDIPQGFLRAKEIGIGDEHTFVALVNGNPTVVKPYDEKSAVSGDLFVDTTLNGIHVKSVFTLLKESAFAKTFTEYASIAEVDVKDIEELSREFTGHGKRAGIDFYRGAVQHTNGYYTGQAIISLNLLIGNPDWKGGLSAGGGAWNALGGKEGQPFDLGKLHTGKLSPLGLKTTREGAVYEESTLYNDKPAKRPWYPFTSDVYQEIIPVAAAANPYSIKILWLHMGTPALSVPGGHVQIEMLKDTEKIPLLISDDIVIGETTMYADYIFPDLSYLERWAFLGAPPSVITKTTKVRQPAAAPIPEIVTVDGEQMPISLETAMIAIAKKLGILGYGQNGFAPGMPLNRPEDFYLKAVANIAAGDKSGDAVPEANEKEISAFRTARKHLPPAVFDEEKWKSACGESNWRKVVYTLNRGGRFESFDKAYSGNYLGHPFGKLFNIFVEPVAKGTNAMTGKRFGGIAIYEPIKDAHGKEIDDGGFDFTLITYKDILGGQSRTLPMAYWMSSIMPENHILINSHDAKRLELKDGDTAKIVSPTNPRGVWPIAKKSELPISGKVKVIEGMRPGVIAVSWSFGHWAYGANDVIVDKKRIVGDKRRHAGLCGNAALRLDPVLKDVCLTDPIGGSSSFYDTKVKLTKV